MVPSIARQSVIIKCNMQSAYILGNYEYYYAAGLASKLLEFEVSDEIMPTELFELLEKELSHADTKDEKEAYLVQRLKDYIPTEDYDEQMKELLQMGKKETCPWQVSI